MINFFKIIDNSLIEDFHMYENTLLEEFKRIFLSTYSECLSNYNLHSEIRIERWIDTTNKWLKKEHDGYSAMLQIDLLNSDNSIIELDEFVCSCFLTITYVGYFPIKRKYRVYQTDDLCELWNEVKHMIQKLNSTNT